jgi:choline dehydrogenase-like flavoprotein
MNRHFDVIVVGSGAAGSFAAQELTERGLRTLLLEAGRNITAGDFKVDPRPPRAAGIQLWDRAMATLSGQPIQSKVTFFGRQTRHFFVNDREHPYTTPQDAPFLWMRGKQLGGRLHTYGRMLLRWSDHDFKAASRDGHGIDWPIGYAELAPYYARAERTLGLYGRSEQLDCLPDGEFIGQAWLTAAETHFKQAVEAKWPERRATAWRYTPPDARRTPQPILAAEKTGNLTLRTDAVVRRVLTDAVSGRATGVEFIDRISGAVEQVHADVVVLSASPIETVRLMLNSASGRHGRGLGNSSGLLGRYFMDQVPSLIMGSVPGRAGWEADTTVEPDPFYGTSGGVYVPRYENLAARSNKRFARGFAYQGTIGRAVTARDRPARFAFVGYGEMLPRADNSVTLHPVRKDAWGMPIPHITCRMSDNERALLHEQMRSIREMVEAAGLQVEFSGSALKLEESGAGAFPDADPVSRWVFRKNFKASMAMGAAIHECGGARMGADPSTSVVNPNNQCWDAPNVFVTDASCFASGGCAGTTLTIMALSIRAAEYIAKRRGAV